MRDGLTSGWGGKSRQDGDADGMNLEVDSKDDVMNERSVIIKEMVGGQDQGAGTARRLKRDKVVKIG